MKRTHNTVASGSTPAVNGLSEDSYVLLARSVRAGLQDVDREQQTEPKSLEALTAEAMNAVGVTHKPEPSRPTSFMGAPDLGHGWNDADSRPAAWRAFGEDVR